MLFQEQLKESLLDSVKPVSDFIKRLQNARIRTTRGGSLVGGLLSQWCQVHPKRVTVSRECNRNAVFNPD